MQSDRAWASQTVVGSGGSYRLDQEPGVAVDVTYEFKTLAAQSARCARRGDHPAAAALAERALRLDGGDLRVILAGVTASGAYAVLERERLRALYLDLLARLADDAFERQDTAACQGYLLRLVALDPAREDAQRRLDQISRVSRPPVPG